MSTPLHIPPCVDRMVSILLHMTPCLNWKKKRGLQKDTTTLLLKHEQKVWSSWLVSTTRQTLGEGCMQILRTVIMKPWCWVAKRFAILLQYGKKLYRIILTISFHGDKSSSGFGRNLTTFFERTISPHTHLHPFSKISSFSKKQFSLPFCQISPSYYFIQSRWRKLEQHICFKSLVLHRHFPSQWHFMRLLLRAVRVCSRQKETQKNLQNEAFAINFCILISSTSFCLGFEHTWKSHSLHSPVSLLMNYYGCCFETTTQTCDQPLG